MGHHSVNTATMLTEFRVGKSKADCVILNGKSTCYEIKTEFDSLARLEAQLNDYSKLFDEVYVVCSEKNVNLVLAKAPTSVGVLILNKKNYFHTKRKATIRNHPVDREMLFKSLRKQEYLELVRSVAGETPKVANGKIFSACFDVVKGVSEDILCKCYLDILKRFRPLNGIFLESLPLSLKGAAVSYDFSSAEINSLRRIMQNKEVSCTVQS